MTRPARIPRTPTQHEKKPDTRNVPRHLAFIRSLPCCVCGKAPRSEAAHIRNGTDGGMALNPSDRWVVPLCAACHRTGPRAQHTVGEVTFWGDLEVDPYGLANTLWTHSGDQKRGERAVLRCLQAVTLRRTT